MRGVAVLLVCVLGVWCATGVRSVGEGKPVRTASGLEKRVPWTTSKVRGSPEPPPPYRTVPAFAKLKFEEPLDLAAAPGTNRLFVAERYGKVYSFVNNADVAKADLALHLAGKDDKGKAFKQVI